MENNSKILIYGYTEEEIQKIKDLLHKNRMPDLLVINKNMSQMKICDILKGLEILTYDVKLPDEKLVLFNNVPDKKIDKGIQIIKDISDKRPIFAQVTPVSQNWSLKYLIEHMIEERQWYIDNGYK
ncbi:MULTISPECIES: DUF3783 domain-containing protein [Clostridium]|uniref:DUF3783 domain-containing protein n=1 Tax=Clostridium TaxID=1485 RepID=UPI00069EC5D8|nr:MULTISPECIES: DUF3783 domain-containing protein [Clostridium]KOF56171.1 hypothetical protein AGR56_04495 [Clostridium sp. DMHC 10]MCD2348224.1 DUF3783 domain-containing protein [Clostridium guangxiense]